MRFRHVVLSALSLGCSSFGGASVASLEAEVRRLRAQQESMAAQIEQLENRVTRENITPRTASVRVESAPARGVVRLGVDGPRDSLRARESDVGATADEPAGTEAAVPLVTAARGDRIAERPAFVVHESDRLPVVPVAPLPLGAAPAGAQAVPAPALPAPHAAAQPAGGADHPLPPMGTLDPGAVRDYEAALTLARGERCDEAVTAFTAFLSRYPEHPHADNAVYWRAECILRSGDRHRALAEFESLIQRYPAGNKVPDALYKIATIQRRLGQREAADSAAQRLMNEFPDSDAGRRMRAERTQSP